MRAIIVEDEINVREGFVKLLKVFCPDVDVLHVCGNVEEGIDTINEAVFDILFLDINLPDGSGFDLIHRLTNKDFKLIFVTAYDKYAIDAFKLSAVDYLLKPVSPELLKKAIQKAKEIVHPKVEESRLEILDNNLNKPTDQLNKIILKDQENLHLIQVKDIIYCQAEGSYTIFKTTDGSKIITSSNLKEYEQLLAPYNFLRSHHAYLVNLNHVVALKKQDGGQLIMSDDSMLSISTRKKAAIIEGIKKIFIN